MNIKTLRNYVRMSQREFSSCFGIPTGTLRNWEQGIAKPPDYVFYMINAMIRRDKMINVETIKFVRMLDKLSELTKNGIEEFEKATETTIKIKLYYDISTSDEDGKCCIVMDACVIDDINCYHHDVISYYGDETEEYKIQVAFDKDNNLPYVLVTLFESGEEIVVDKGNWYFI